MIRYIILGVSSFILFSTQSWSWEDQDINRIIQNKNKSTNQRILALREFIDLNGSDPDIFEYLKIRIPEWTHLPIDGGMERFNVHINYPIVRVMLPYDLATEVFIEGALQNSDPDLVGIFSSALLSQKRFHGIDATHLLELEAEKFDNNTEEFAEITELIKSLARVQIVPKELVIPLSEQEPSIEELMLERNKKREKELHRRENVQHRKPPQRFTQEKNTLTSDLPISQEPNSAGKESSERSPSKRVIIVVLIGVVVFLLAFKIGRFIR